MPQLPQLPCSAFLGALKPKGTPWLRVSGRPCDRRLVDTESTSPSLRHGLNEARSLPLPVETTHPSFRVKTLFTNCISHMQTRPPIGWVATSCSKVNLLTKGNLFNFSSLTGLISSFVFIQNSDDLNSYNYYPIINFKTNKERKKE